MSWNHSKLIYDSQINDSKCQLWSCCMPALSHPLMRRTNTSLSCCSVWPCLESQQSKLNCKYSIHHTRTRAIFVLSWTIWFNYKRVWRDIYSVRCHWSAHLRLRMTISAQSIVPSVTRNWRTTRWDIMHMWLENTWMVLTWSITRLDNTFTPVARSATCNYRSTRRTIDCQYTSTMDFITTSHSS